MVFVVGSLFFLTQFIKSHDLLFFDMIFWILLSKKDHFVLLTILLNFFQSRLELDVLYTIESLLYCSFYYALEYLVILTYLEYLFQKLSKINANSCTTLLSDLLTSLIVMLILPISFLSLLIKLSSSSLFLIIVQYLFWMNSLLIMISTIKGAWSNRLYKLGKHIYDIWK